MFDNVATLPFSYYTSAANPFIVPPAGEWEVGDIRDDVADIYRDLVTGVRLHESGFVSAANEHWHLLFWHWGEHATNAMAALHRYLLDQAVVMFGAHIRAKE